MAISIDSREKTPLDEAQKKKYLLQLKKEAMKEYENTIGKKMPMGHFGGKSTRGDAKGFLGKLKSTFAYRMFASATWVAHLMMIVAVISVIAALTQSKMEGTEGPKSYAMDWIFFRSSFFMNFVYLACFSVHFGTQIWMSSVSGYSLYYSLPRHTFGEVQRVLFPRYFGINNILSFVTLLIFASLHPVSVWGFQLTLQVAVMVLCFLVEVVIYLYIVPQVLELIDLKTAMEKVSGVGMEIGRHDAGNLVNCSHYMLLHKMFRRTHMVIAICNIVCMVCTVVHMLYLTNKLSGI